MARCRSVVKLQRGDSLARAQRRACGGARPVRPEWVAHGAGCQGGTKHEAANHKAGTGPEISGRSDR